MFTRGHAAIYRLPQDHPVVLTPGEPDGFDAIAQRQKDPVATEDEQGLIPLLNVHQPARSLVDDRAAHAHAAVEPLLRAELPQARDRACLDRLEWFGGHRLLNLEGPRRGNPEFDPGQLPLAVGHRAADAAHPHRGTSQLL